MQDTRTSPEILVVDNDERIVELVSWFLRKRGYVVRSAASFEEARVALEERRPDLMLSDIDMGIESALEELPRLHAAGTLPPTLVVSGFLDAAITSELTSLAPVLGTLAKPFDFTDLEDRVQVCLEQLRVGAPAQPAQDGGDWAEIIPARAPRSAAGASTGQSPTAQAPAAFEGTQRRE